MEATNKRSVRLPTFDGSQAQFQLWWTRFQSYAVVCKFSEALKDGSGNPLPASEATALDESVTAQKAQAEARKRNAVAMAILTMAFMNEATMGIVYKSQT